jgi:hypothetical protein
MFGFTNRLFRFWNILLNFFRYLLNKIFMLGYLAHYMLSKRQTRLEAGAEQFCGESAESPEGDPVLVNAVIVTF